MLISEQFRSLWYIQKWNPRILFFGRIFMSMPHFWWILGQYCEDQVQTAHSSHSLNAVRCCLQVAVAIFQLFTVSLFIFVGFVWYSYCSCFASCLALVRLYVSLVFCVFGDESECECELFFKVFFLLLFLLFL